MTQRYAIKFAYLGQNYQGFQRQRKSIKTIEGTIIEVLLKLNYLSRKKPTNYATAGRTDKGVNAISQVISFDSLREDIILEEINQHLPDDIYAWAKAKVSETFNARRDAISRTYRFYHPYSNENLEVMNEGLKKLLGTHDFTKLCKKPDILPSGFQKSTILTLEKANLDLIENKRILMFEFTSRSFLWHQVRKMVSLIINIGNGMYDSVMVEEALNPKSKLPKSGIKPVPADGLVLYDIIYPEISFETINKKVVIESKLLEFWNKYNSLSSVLNLMRDSFL